GGGLRPVRARAVRLPAGQRANPPPPIPAPPRPGHPGQAAGHGGGDPRDPPGPVVQPGDRGGRSRAIPAQPGARAGLHPRVQRPRRHRTVALEARGALRRRRSPEGRGAAVGTRLHPRRPIGPADVPGVSSLRPSAHGTGRTDAGVGHRDPRSAQAGPCIPPLPVPATTGAERLTAPRPPSPSPTLVVGAGYAGSVVARELADAGRRVLVIDKRPHVAGNAYDEPDAHGVLVHRYGPHIFHTNGERIWEWLSRFTGWRPYEHRVRGVVDGREYPFPINRDTLNQLYGL